MRSDIRNPLGTPDPLQIGPVSGLSARYDTVRRAKRSLELPKPHISRSKRRSSNRIRGNSGFDCFHIFTARGSVQITASVESFVGCGNAKLRKFIDN